MGGIEQATTSTNLTIGSTYFIRVYDYHENLNAGLSGGTDFQICVTCNTSSGVACTNYASIPFSASYNENANSGTFSVSASGTGCMFSAMSNCSWINSLTTSPGVVAYNVDANTNCSSRTCTISIFDGSSVLQPSATYTVTQAGVSPPSCGTIFSSTNICESSIQNYSISCSNATSYNWIVPFGWFINSGQRTSSINVTVGANTGQVCVIPFNGNCQSAPVCSNTILVTPMPSQLGLITGATTTQPNTQQSYFVPAISSAIAYQWTTPFTWTVVANGTSNTPTFDMNSGSSGNLCVSAINSCGISSPSCIFISTASVGIYEVGATTKFTIYPNPSEEIIHIMGDGIGNGTYEIVLTNAVGQQVKNQSLKISTHSMETVISIEELPSGIYFLSISSDMVKQIVKVEKR
jgi:hypothetical protein